jgi:hypothetical protein
MKLARGDRGGTANPVAPCFDVDDGPYDLVGKADGPADPECLSGSAGYFAGTTSVRG